MKTKTPGVYLALQPCTCITLGDFCSLLHPLLSNQLWWALLFGSFIEMDILGSKEMVQELNTCCFSIGLKFQFLSPMMDGSQ